MDQPTLQPTRGSGLQAEPVLTDELLHRMDRPGPRYTSYPTADRFVEAFTAEHFLQHQGVRYRRTDRVLEVPFRHAEHTH